MRHFSGSEKAAFTGERKNGLGLISYQRMYPADPVTAQEHQPNKETIVAMREAERIAKDLSVEAYSDIDELFGDLRE